MTLVNVFTGFLGIFRFLQDEYQGAGKTTIIISLIKRLPSEYNVVVLKNEFGDVKGRNYDLLCLEKSIVS